MYGVDHGVSLHTQNKLRTVLWGWAGDRIDERVLADLLGLDDKLTGPLGTQLREHITVAEISALRRRIRALLDEATMPVPENHRPLPWPAF